MLALLLVGSSSDRAECRPLGVLELVSGFSGRWGMVPGQLRTQGSYDSFIWMELYPCSARTGVDKLVVGAESWS